MPSAVEMVGHHARRPARALHLSVVLAGILALSARPAGATAPDGARAPASSLPPAPPQGCTWEGNAIAYADDLLDDVYSFAPQHPPVSLPHDLTWTEDPLNDVNWRYQLHSLHFIRALLNAWTQAGDARYSTRAVEILQDWIHDNPRHGAPSAYSWNDMATAIRGIEMACARRILGPSAWLDAALRLHGRTLADPGFYVWGGNHALNQDIGLLDIGYLMHRSDWKDLAQNRLADLVVRSIDSQGVTNEQSISYEGYNYSRYHEAADHLIAYGMTVPAEFARVDKMPRFLAYATLPNGEYEMIGDSQRRKARKIVGTIAEFAATQGVSGPKPTAKVALFVPGGWLFARTGWGETRPYADEVAYTAHFGPARIWHGHLDGGSVTLYGYGTRLVMDPGQYTYQPGRFRNFFVGRSAHNVVTVDGLGFVGVSTPLVAHRESARGVDTIVTNDGYAGVHSRRRIVFSKRMGYLLVEDRLTSTQDHSYHQLWHLPEDAAPQIDGADVTTRRARSNLLIRQLRGGDPQIIMGAKNPIQGWVSYSYGEKLAAPVVDVRKTGTSVRFLTLLVPTEGPASATVSGLTVTAGGFRMTITIGDLSETVNATATGFSIVDG